MSTLPCTARLYPVASFARLRVTIPLFDARVPADFPSSAEGYLQRPIDLNELLVTNPPVTFILRVEGESMRTDDPGEQTIGHGDLFIVNRAVETRNGHIVARLDGEFTVKKYRRQDQRVWLEPANNLFARTEVRRPGYVRAATMGAAKPQGWQMRREHKTPCYTTRVEDVPRASI